MKDNNETSLWSLISSFFEWIKKTFIAFLYLLGKIAQLTYRQFIIIALVTLLGLAVGLYFSRPSERFYKSEAMAVVNGVTPQMVKGVNKQLELAFPKHINPALSLETLLNIPDEMAAGIRSIRTYYVIDCKNDSTPDFVDFNGNHPLEDTLNVISPFHLYFEVKTKRVNELDAVQEALLNYLNTNSVLQSVYDEHKQMLAREIEVYTYELELLEKLSENTYIGRDFSIPQIHSEINRLLIGEQRTQLLHKDKSKVLYNLRVAKNEMVLCNAPVVFLNQLSATPKAINSRIKLCILGLIGGYLLGIILGLTFENRKNILSFLQKR